MLISRARYVRITRELWPCFYVKLTFHFMMQSIKFSVGFCKDFFMYILKDIRRLALNITVQRNGASILFMLCENIGDNFFFISSRI